jgi:hypothetical protein
MKAVGHVEMLGARTGSMLVWMSRATPHSPAPRDCIAPDKNSDHSPDVPADVNGVGEIGRGK